MRTWMYIDKSKWGPGPWQEEPDKAQWKDEATGLTCLIVRQPRLGHLCGYAGVPPGHPLHGKNYDDVDADVHGGLTFSRECDGDPEHGVCHVPEPGEPEHLWWFGFDAAHCFNLSPGIEPFNREAYLFRHSVYRDFAYMRSQCESLASQLANVKVGAS
jgi:hypothetical protein